MNPILEYENIILRCTDEEIKKDLIAWQEAHLRELNINVEMADNDPNIANPACLLEQELSVAQAFAQTIQQNQLWIRQTQRLLDRPVQKTTWSFLMVI
jgi:hypothetical protein